MPCRELDSKCTRQDSIVLNLQRACETVINLAMHVVRVCKLELPQENREEFALLNQACLLDDVLMRRNASDVDFQKCGCTCLSETELACVACDSEAVF